MSGFLVFDLLRLHIASLLNKVVSVPVKRGGLYHTSDFRWPLKCCNFNTLYFWLS